MALEVHAYDIVCFAIVAAALVGATWIIRSKEAPDKSPDETLLETILTPETHGSHTGVTPVGYIGTHEVWESCWRGVHPLWLLATRAVSAVVMVFFLVWDIEDWSLTIFVYYTEWTFTLVIFYFVLGTIVSAHACWEYFKKGSVSNDERTTFLRRDIEENMGHGSNGMEGNIKLQGNHEQKETKQRARFLGYTMQIVYQTCAGAVVLTDVVFWLVIVPFLNDDRFSLNLLMGSMHSLNAVFLLLDTALNNMRFPFFRMAYFVLWSCIYVIFQWVIHACGVSWWPYPFLELSTPWAPLWYFCLALVHIPCYGIYALIVKLKYYFLHAGVSSN
ncbi:uncharacterized protein LOC18431379 isoform X1 [Amborella trichopoda]|uniref:uncharacterized protein LOC18431379 isoform X1 n=1 Tax=Amborella trichopoda TaxID=13333 RepID=UPI0005D36638|nr:uncharacterized protein LOC18431379 isoform X1 [Amborella trichopoda]|eukprot:XP_011622261.1 uncharacterized protein LOC18431379 isoform X1 [Amborella trichopoda]